MSITLVTVEMSNKATFSHVKILFLLELPEFTEGSLIM